MPPTTKPMINPADRVLFIDGEAIVIDKPAGLAVHAGPSTRSSLEDHLVGFRFGFHAAAVCWSTGSTATLRAACCSPATPRRTSASPAPSTKDWSRKPMSRSWTACPTAAADASSWRWPRSPAVSRAGGWCPTRTARRRSPHWEVLAVRNGRAAGPVHAGDRPHPPDRVHAASGLGIPILGDPVYGAGEGPMLLHALSR